jgi:hypothetical protein
MYQYLAQIKEIKDIEPHAGQYKVYYATCPFCGYECEVHAVSELSIHDLYPKCHVCKRKLFGDK